MDPVLKAVLLSWDWRLDVLLVLAAAGTLYVAGWRRLWARTHASRNRRQRRPLVARWRLVAYLGGLFVLGVALLSPIDVLSGQLFFMHMIQHLLLIMIAPPLLLIANPMPFILWGLPASGRRRVGGVMSDLLHRESAFRRGLRAATAPTVLWMVMVVSIIGWHDQTAYNATLENDFIHDLEHLNFFLAGMLFWWRITGAGPRVHRRGSHIGRIALVVAAIPPNMLTGVVLAFARAPFYSYYTQIPRLWGIDALTDQQIGGIIMWVPGSMMYIIAALILAAQLLKGESVKPSLPEATWATEEALIAPGLKK
jgi:putative membrane protein